MPGESIVRALALIACAAALTLAGLVTLLTDDPAPPRTPPAIELMGHPARESPRTDGDRPSGKGTAPARERPARNPAPPSGDPVGAFAPPDPDDDDRDDPFDDMDDHGEDTGAGDNGDGDGD